MTAERESFVELVRPLAALLAPVPLADVGAARKEIDRIAPFDGELVRGIAAAAVAAGEAGWLLPKEANGLHFGRVTRELEGFSLDAVLMDGPGPRHRHPRGEIDLCLTRDGTPSFDGRPEGWVIYGPGSEHVPAVAGGTMLILYFLPGGAIEWL